VTPDLWSSLAALKVYVISNLGIFCAFFLTAADCIICNSQTDKLLIITLLFVKCSVNVDGHYYIFK